MEHPPRSTSPMRLSRAFWRDERVIQVAAQILFLALVIWVGSIALRNMLTSLQQQGLVLGFDFLNSGAGFDISDAPIPYSSTDTFARALQVGLLNTILVSVLGIVLSTLLGIVVGVARLSSNWLVNRMAWVFVEVMRNVPLLVLLVFIYTAFFLKLPRARQAVSLGPIYLSNRGVAIPWGEPTDTWSLYVSVLIGALIAGAVVGLAMRWWQNRSGRPRPQVVPSLLTMTLIALIGWFALPQPPLALSLPEIAGFNFRGGQVLSPEFMALLIGLVIYTAAFIGEVVRAGIQAVPKGQVEAARALGLNPSRTLRLVVFPQALRVIIPPVTNQYLNLTKNSTLAVAIGYPDLFAISGTIINQTGRAVEMIAVVMAVYLMLSLITSLVMNWYNRRVRLVER
ncbi:amino acid ABC transporter permease [Roseiflexus sp. RS-1]|uniref:amino acid ABC transporter permease n=1 Tax=Roseiflexus sp. (strain RS-1) TaxID=357808 RepID=UPI0000D8192E|nr:ABC transporter permease subunit [Roseiflexus sp. RS-1]ABQ92349.1 polar amino acid ABC transporter, inner membrane subunit [Roseiflexus sp. RS-1]